MTYSNDAISFAGDRNLRKLEDGIVSSSETAIVRQGVQLGVGDVPFNDGPKIVDRLKVWLVRPDLLGVQQVLPSHSQSLTRRATHLLRQILRSDFFLLSSSRTQRQCTPWD